jgi:hypothetical protein
LPPAPRSSTLYRFIAFSLARSLIRTLSPCRLGVKTKQPKARREAAADQQKAFNKRA